MDQDELRWRRDKRFAACRNRCRGGDALHRRSGTSRSCPRRRRCTPTSCASASSGYAGCSRTRVSATYMSTTRAAASEHEDVGYSPTRALRRPFTNVAPSSLQLSTLSHLAAEPRQRPSDAPQLAASIATWERVMFNAPALQPAEAHSESLNSEMLANARSERKAAASDAVSSSCLATSGGLSASAQCRRVAAATSEEGEGILGVRLHADRTALCIAKGRSSEGGSQSKSLPEGTSRADIRAERSFQRTTLDSTQGT